MPDDAPRYQIGNIGEGATVLQGEYLYNIIVKLQEPKDAAELVRQIKQRGEPVYYGPLLRRLDPIVFVNRSELLAEINRFFADSTVSILYLLGLPAIGKSTLVRGALELRRADTPAVWMACEGLDAEQLLAEINAGLHLDTNAILGDSHARLAKKIAAVFGSITNPTILVFDGFEALLDTSDNFSSRGMTELFEALVTLEHKAKVLVTTRRLPYGVGEGSAGVQIMRLGGLSDPMAEALFQTRAQLTPEQSQALLSRDVLRQLRGHPKFIELLASAITELPAQQVATALLQTSDIGSFVIGQVFGQMKAAELQLLRAALVFRGVFTFDALNAVYSALNGEAHTITQLVRTLVRRAVLETVVEPQIAYHLHPVLRDAVPREAEQEATARAAAGKWFLHQSFNPADLRTWDDGLYQLRRAAEIGGGKHFEAYKDFLDRNHRELHYAGWHQRLISEYELLDSIAPDEWNRVMVRMEWARELWMAGHGLKALEMNREAAEIITELRAELPEGDKRGLRGLLIIKSRIGDTLATEGHFEEAQKLADELEVLVEEIGDAGSKYCHRSLRWQIARKRWDDPEEVLHWAKETLRFAMQQLQDSPSKDAEDSVAEAHFAMAASYLRTGNPKKMFEHMWQQLHIKVKIRKLGGIAAGLSNLGVVLMADSFSEAGAMLLTAEQISLETGHAESENEATIEPAIQELLTNSQRIEQGREFLGTIWDGLLPYYERGLSRRLGR